MFNEEDKCTHLGELRFMTVLNLNYDARLTL